MNDDFIQNTTGRGEIGKRWLEEIPDIIKELEADWDVKILNPYNLSFNYVALAQQSNGNQVVLKLVFPTDKEFKTEVDALKLYNGEGSIKLLKVDEGRNAMLLEHVKPGIPLSTLGDDIKMTSILTSLMKKVWKKPPQNHSFPNIKDWVCGIQRYNDRFKGSGPFWQSLVDRAEELFKGLIDSTKEEVVCHGDFHHYNVLSAQREPWLVIDPKGIVADPAYDTAVMLQNPEIKITKDILETRIYQLSEEVEIDKKRIYKWGLAHTVLSALWAIEDGSGDGHKAIEVAELLTDIRI